MSLAIGLANLKPAEGTTSAKVTVVTRTSRGAFQDESLPFQVVRQPSLRQMVSLIRATDVIHLAGPAMLPLLAALLLRKPAVVEHHGFQSICPNGQLLYEPTQKACPGHFMAGRHMNCLRCNSKNSLLRSINMWLLTFPRRWMCMRASANISPTDWLAAMLNLPRTTTIHHGVGRVAAGSVPTFPPSHATFAFIGRLVSTKGVESLLEAAQQLHAEGFRFRLKVIGDGPDRESLRQQASAMGLDESIEFLGYLSPQGLEDHLAEAATVVMPSLAGEVFGMVAAESMSRGKLMIVSDVGALREVIGDTGFSFAPGDAAGLANCMKRVLYDATVAARFGGEARKRAGEHFDQHKMLLQHLAVHREAVRCDG